MRRGITIDRLDDWPQVCATAQSLHKKTGEQWWVRVVFDLENEPKEYTAPLKELAAAAKNRRRIVDSAQLDNLCVQEHRDRCSAYANEKTLKEFVSCWENR